MTKVPTRQQTSKLSQIGESLGSSSNSSLTSIDESKTNEPIIKKQLYKDSDKNESMELVNIEFRVLSNKKETSPLKQVEPIENKEHYKTEAVKPAPAKNRLKNNSVIS